MTSEESTFSSGLGGGMGTGANEHAGNESMGSMGEHAASGMGGHGSASPGMGNLGSMADPAAWPRAAEDLSREMSRRGWSAPVLAALGSVVTVLGGVALLARRRRRSGLMAAMPSQLADAASEQMEQMMRMKNMKMPGRSNNGGSWWRTAMAVVAFALAGWGIRRRFSHQM